LFLKSTLPDIEIASSQLISDVVGSAMEGEGAGREVFSCAPAPGCTVLPRQTRTRAERLGSATEWLSLEADESLDIRAEIPNRLPEERSSINTLQGWSGDQVHTVPREAFGK
jgi:hypothetical protein